MRRAGSAFLALWRSLWHDERGISLVFTAITITVLLAITGLAVDVGWWYTVHRQNQSAADAAALSAAYEVLHNPSWTQSQLISYANTAATQNGYAGSTPTGSCSANSSRVCYKYSDSSFSGAVEVQLQQPQNTWFASLAGLDSVTITNRAVAMVVTLDTPCMYVVDPTASQALSVTGSASITAKNCAICDNSTSASAVYMQGGANANIVADTLLVRGQVGGTGSATPTLNHPAQLGFQGCGDPFASKLTHTYLTNNMATTPCQSSTSNGVVNWYGPVAGSGNCLFSGNLTKGTTNSLAPGTYWIAGQDLVLPDGGGSTGAGATILECTSCTIILTTAAGTSSGTVGGVQLGSLADLNLTGPTTGPFAGMVLLQDSNGLTNATWDASTAKANATETLSGLVYFPKSAITFQGTPVANGPQCLLVIADTMALQGNPTMDTTACASMGLTTPSIQTVALVE